MQLTNKAHLIDGIQEPTATTTAGEGEGENHYSSSNKKAGSLKKSLSSATTIKSMIQQSGMEDDMLEQQTAFSHSELTLSFKKDHIDDILSLTHEKDSKVEYFSDTEIAAQEQSCNILNASNNEINNHNKTSNKSSKKKKEITPKGNSSSSSNQTVSKAKGISSKKNKRELRCKTVVIQQEKKTHAHRLDFDFLVFDSLKYAENKSPLSMACYHKSMDKFEMNIKDKLLTVHMDTLDKIKTPITLILKKLISDSNSSAKDLCDSLYYFHKLLKKFRMIRENNTDKINIFKQLMPILPNHQTPEQVLASDPKFPSLTATYKINARKGTISLDKYTFNEKLAHLLGFPTLEHLKQNIQFTKKFPSLSVPSDYYSYIMECLLNKFEKQRNSVSPGYIKTFDGIKVAIREKLVSRCHIDNDITPEQINIQKQELSQSFVNGSKCKIEEEDFDDLNANNSINACNKQQQEDEDEEDNDGFPQGILYVMTKHFFFVENQELSNYIFSKERLAICESIDYSTLYAQSLPNPKLTQFNYIHSKYSEFYPTKSNTSKSSFSESGDSLRKKRFLNNGSGVSERSDKESESIHNIKQEFPFNTNISPLAPSLCSMQQPFAMDIPVLPESTKQEDMLNFSGIDLLEIIKQQLFDQFSSQNTDLIQTIPQTQSISSVASSSPSTSYSSQANGMEIESDSDKSRCSFRYIESNCKLEK